jgi:spermidine/putrescine transport system permease protein
MGKPKKRENVYLGFVFLFIYLPVIILFVFSFNTSSLNVVWEGFTFDWYVKLLSSSSDIMSAFWNSVVVATGTTIVSTIIGTLGAIGMAKYKFIGKKTLDAVLYIPIVIPEIVLGIALLSYFTTIKIALGMTALIIAHSSFCIPFVINNVRARLAGFDRSVEEASLDLGANRWQTLTKVTLPIIMPGITAGAMLSFALSMDDIIISFFVTSANSTTLPVKILSMVRTGVTPEVNALCILLLLLSVVLVGGANLVNAKRDKNYGLDE